MATTKKSQKKNKGLKQYAPIGLWLAGIALLATIVVLIFKFLAITNIYTTTNTKAWNLALVIAAGLVFIGLALFALFDPKRVRDFFEGRQGRYGSNAAILLLAFIGIIVVVNVIVFQNPGKPIDLTANKENTLAPETIAALEALPEPVHATAFFSANYSSTTATQLLKNFETYSKGKFTYEFINPDQNPVAAQQAGISGDGKIYLQMGDQHEIVAYASEQDITDALVRLMNPGQRVIYFLTGHGERSIDSTDTTGYSSVKSALEAKNYTIDSLNLLAENKIPADAKVIVIAGPTDPISANEMKLLKDYVTNGGALVIMEEPIPLTNYGNNPDPLAAYLATDWGITLTNDIVLDTNSPQAVVAVAASYGDHAITQKLAGLVSFFPTTRSISIDPSASPTPVALVLTASAAWGETDFQTQSASFDSTVDFPGPLTLATAVENTTSNSRLVVFGDADFASDTYFSQYANGDLFINSIDWAAGEEQMISLTTPDQTTRTLNPPSSVTKALLAISMICLIPGLIIAGGVASWLIRRSRG
jgi:ABC-type uncharacterized transport system involved in gliding motility auxiliary subunit